MNLFQNVTDLFSGDFFSLNETDEIVSELTHLMNIVSKQLIVFNSEFEGESLKQKFIKDSKSRLEKITSGCKFTPEITTLVFKIERLLFPSAHIILSDLSSLITRYLEISDLCNLGLVSRHSEEIAAKEMIIFAERSGENLKKIDKEMALQFFKSVRIFWQNCILSLDEPFSDYNKTILRLQNLTAQEIFRIFKQKNIYKCVVESIVLKNPASLSLKTENFDEDAKHDSRDALWESAISGNLKVTKILLENKADLSLKEGPDAFRPIYCAINNGHEALVKYYLDLGIPVDCCTLDRETLLMMANNQPHIAELLLLYGADVKAVNAYGISVYKYYRGTIGGYKLMKKYVITLDLTPKRRHFFLKSAEEAKLTPIQYFNKMIDEKMLSSLTVEPDQKKHE